MQMSPKRNEIIIGDTTSGRFSNLVDSNIYIRKIYWTKSNFLSKFNFKSDEDKKQTFTRFLCRKCQIPPYFTCFTEQSFYAHANNNKHCSAS